MLTPRDKNYMIEDGIQISLQKFFTTITKFLQLIRDSRYINAPCLPYNEFQIFLYLTQLFKGINLHMLLRSAQTYMFLSNKEIYTGLRF